jgi:hypothetical protein
MSVAAANEWYHAERRVMSKRQRAAVDYKDGDHDVAGSNLLAGFFIIIFFALCLIKKYFFNRKYF